MSQKDLFELLGAPLHNVVWSWGAVRAVDETVFLRVWQDRTFRRDGTLWTQITHNEYYEKDPKNNGHQERLEHVELIKRGAECYLIMCQAVDVDAAPRTVKDFEKEHVFRGTKIVERDGEAWIELGPRVKVRDAQI